MHEMYAKDISKKISSTVRTKQKKGEFTGAYASYGYQKDPNNINKLIIDPETAPIVKQIFELRAEGLGYIKICHKLIEMDIPSPCKYRYKKSIEKYQSYANTEWSQTTIKLILRNEIYIGNLVQGRKRGALYEDGGSHSYVDKSEWIIVQNTHEPIIPKELFDKVQSISQLRTEKSNSERNKYAYVTKNNQPLKDLIYCADCGSKLYLRKRNYKGTNFYWNYCCGDYNKLGCRISLLKTRYCPL